MESFRPQWCPYNFPGLWKLGSAYLTANDFLLAQQSPSCWTLSGNHWTECLSQFHVPIVHPVSTVTGLAPTSLNFTFLINLLSHLSLIKKKKS